MGLYLGGGTSVRGEIPVFLPVLNTAITRSDATRYQSLTYQMILINE